jgi:hypothetical protein
MRIIMPKAFRAPPTNPNDRIASTSRFREAKAKQAAKIADLRDTLINSGYDTLQKQATALGLLRSTAWHLLNGNYKGSGLSAPIIKRMLSSPRLPEAARDLIQEYVAEKLLGAYGHDRARLKVFRRQLGLPEQPVREAAEQDLEF